MKEFFVLRKTGGLTADILTPAHASDLEEIKGLPLDQPVRVKVTQVRNVDFHRKYFALLNFAFDIWEPPESEAQGAVFQRWGITPEKNFDRFRKDIAILCGFYESTIRVNGDVQITAKSISFAKMSQDEFEQLYEKTIDVVLKRVFTSGAWANSRPEQLKSAVDQVLEYL